MADIYSRSRAWIPEDAARRLPKRVLTVPPAHSEVPRGGRAHVEALSLRLSKGNASRMASAEAGLGARTALHHNGQS